jgi:hypothetical protein
VPVEGLDERILPGRAGFDVAGPAWLKRHQSRSDWLMNSGPLSQRISFGARPRSSTICSRTLTLSSAPILRAAGVAKASRVCSSVTVRILIGLPSAVRSLTKSIAQISFGAAAVR